MRVALDTNRLTDLFRGDSDLALWLGTCDEVWIPFVVLGEFKAGFEGGRLGSANESLLTTFLSKSTVGVLFPDRGTTDHYARVFVQLRRAGKPIPANDLWIAALALQHDLRLVTRDAHFEHLPQLLTA